MVRGLVLFVLLFLVDLLRDFPCRLQMRFARRFRADRAERNHALQIFLMAVRALLRWRRRVHDKVFELFSAFVTLIFVDRHTVFPNVGQETN